MNRWLLAVWLLGQGACGHNSFDPESHELRGGAWVRITVSAGPHRPGTVVPLSVQNAGGHEYIWNPCIRSLERLEGTEWSSIGEGRVCTLEGWMLSPGKRTDASTDLPAALTAGQYRFRYGFSREQGGFSVSDDQVSNAFTVNP